MIHSILFNRLNGVHLSTQTAWRVNESVTWVIIISCNGVTLHEIMMTQVTDSWPMPNHKLKQCWLNYWHLGTNFREIRIKIQNVSFKLQQFWLDLTVTTALSRPALLSLQYMNLFAFSWIQQVPCRCRIYLIRERGTMRKNATFLKKNLLDAIVTMCCFITCSKVMQIIKSMHLVDEIVWLYTNGRSI